MQILIYEFLGDLDGAEPNSSLIIDGSNALYGTTRVGGDGSNVGYGTVFQIKPPTQPGGRWRERILHRFNGSDGNSPRGRLVMGKDGQIYGLTYGGGSNNYGTVYQLMPRTTPDGLWAHTVIYSFPGGGGEGQTPQALTLGDSGVLYGTTNRGGRENCGTVFQLNPPAAEGGPWTHKVIYKFMGGLDGIHPSGDIVLDAAGSLYGTTERGGEADSRGSGTVYKLEPELTSAGVWTASVLLRFSGAWQDGENPHGIVRGANGGLYCPTLEGGSANFGTVVELLPPLATGDSWRTSVILNCTEGFGRSPAGLAIDRVGAIYGTTETEGPKGRGTVFKLVPPVAPSSKWTPSTIYSFGSPLDGSMPRDGVTFDKVGNLYGTTAAGGSGGMGNQGTIFKIGPELLSVPW